MAAALNEEHRQMIDAFPYPPYEIQQRLMVNVYEALQHRRIGLFESPTGTGKTLSLICSTLRWLEDERRAQEAAAAKTADDDNALPDWMRSYSPTPAEPLQQTQTEPKHKQKARQQAKAPQVLDDHGNDISEFLVTDEQAAAGRPGSGSKRTAAEAGYVSSSDEQETDAADNVPTNPAVQQAAAPRSPQLIFCSRTHSQLSQFVGELHRTRYADSVMLVAVGSRKALCVNDEVLKLQNLSQINERCLDLQRSKASASKKASATAAPSSNSQQVVSFMQQSSKRKQGKQPGSNSGCPYLSAAGGAAAWEGFTDLVTAAPIDVEELANLGRKKKLCPYYGSRRAVPLVDVVLAPYSTILMPDARDSMGIQLKDAVLVFDEAHNLLDAINGAHSTAVTAWQLLSVQRSLSAYYERFKSFLNPVNAQNIQLMLRIAAALHKCLTHLNQQQYSSDSPPTPTSTSVAGRVVTVNDVLFELGIDNINMFELASWVKENKMAFKVSGYTAAAVAGAEGAVDLQHKPQQEPMQPPPQRSATGIRGKPGPGQGDSNAAHTAHDQQAGIGQLSGRDGVSAIHSFVSFLLSLTNSDEDGRVIIQPTTAAAAAAAAAAEDKPPAAANAIAADQASAASAGRGSHMRYILLNAARHFGRLLASARSVVLVSGTLAPIDGLKAQLFPDLPADRLLHFECGHVVPADQLLAVSIGRGPSGRTLNLRHENRNDAAVIDELGQLLLNIAAVVPEGVVVFAPSFGYLEQLVNRWSSSGVMMRLKQRKQVFREPRSATEVEEVLTAYAAAITASNNSVTAQSCDEPAAPGTAPGSSSAPAASTAGSTSGSSAGGPRVAGGVMLCVVGGKLSEGINFGDGLGRCVVMLGMPYPNPADPELRERMNYLDKQAAAAAPQGTSQQRGNPGSLQHAQQPIADLADLSCQQQQQQQQQQAAVAVEPPGSRTVFQPIHVSSRQPRVVAPQLAAKAASQQVQPESNNQGNDARGSSRVTGAAAAGSQGCSGPVHGNAGGGSPCLITGREYYDDLCFKAVNQCVGRVVRHRGDYAAIVLVDSRWVVSPADWAAINTAEGQARDQAAAVPQQQQHQHQEQQELSQGCGGPAGVASSSSRGDGRRLPVQKLPGWVQRSYVPTSGEFGQAYKQLAQFFKRRQAQQQQQQQRQIR